MCLWYLFIYFICQLKIADHDKIFGEDVNEQITQLVINNVKDVIIRRRKTIHQMLLSDVKMSFRLHALTIKNIQVSGSKWRPFIDQLKTDGDTKNSWYIF